MKPEEHKQLIADFNAWNTLSDAVEQAPAWRSALPPGDARKEEEAAHLAQVNGAHAQLQAVEERIDEWPSVSVIRFLRANRHVIQI